MKMKKGFTLIEVMIALAMFSTASVVIFSVFISNHMRMEAQGKETFLQESVDRGITSLTDRMKGTTEVLEIGNGVDFLIKFKYYYRSNDSEFEGRLYLEEKDGQKHLKLESTKDGNTTTREFMKYIDVFELKLLDQNGGETLDVHRAASVIVTYEISTSFRKIRKKKSGDTIIKFRNVQ